MINGTAFHFGRALCSYEPLSHHNQAQHIVIGSKTNLIAQSQRPHIFLDPSQSQGGCLCLPYFFKRSFLEIPVEEWSELGDMTISSFTTLKHSMGGTDDVTVKIFAWASNVVLSVPTVSNTASLTRTSVETFVSQADEYNEGRISGPASAVAQAAGMLSSVPGIGVYATAAGLAASAVSSIARLFGWSRPAIISNISYMKPRVFGNAANCDQDEAVTKLTVDSKCQLTVDPRTVGLDGTDELDIKYIATKESYFTQFLWTTGDAPGDSLFECYVSPVLFDQSSSGIYQMTPMCFAALPFKYWSGSITYRFQIVASQFHRGRLRFTWDPIGYDLVDATHTYNTAYNRIVDLAEERDFEITVNYAMPDSYQDVDHGAIASEQIPFTSSGSLSAHNYRKHNGTFVIAVVNELVAADNTVNNDIMVNCFARAGDDIEFRAPCQTVVPYLSNFMPQSQEYSHYEKYSWKSQGDEDEVLPVNPLENKPEGASPIQEIGTSFSDQDKKSLVFFGENITSFRPLLKRYNYCMQHYTKSLPSAKVATWLIHTRPFPYYAGYDPNGIHQTTDGVKYNYVKQTLINYLTPAYVGRRGSIRRKYAILRSDQTSLGGTLSVMRSFVANSYSATWNKVYNSTESDIKAASNSMIYNFTGYNGNNVVCCAQCPVNEVEFPYYNRHRFSFARQLDINRGSSSDDSDIDSVRIELTDTPTICNIHDYVAAGEDFQLFWFLNVPTMYWNVLPTPGSFSLSTFSFSEVVASAVSEGQTYADYLVSQGIDHSQITISNAEVVARASIAATSEVQWLDDYGLKPSNITDITITTYSAIKILADAASQTVLAYLTIHPIDRWTITISQAVLTAAATAAGHSESVFLSLLSMMSTVNVVDP